MKYSTSLTDTFRWLLYGPQGTAQKHPCTGQLKIIPKPRTENVCQVRGHFLCVNLVRVPRGMEGFPVAIPVGMTTQTTTLREQRDNQGNC